MFNIVIFAVLFLRCQADVAEYEDIGCFKDERTNRTFPELLVNLRDTIDWKNEWPSFGRVIKKCAALAKEKGYLYFGIQYYGECWSGANSHRTFYKYGKSERCVHGVGKSCANRVYMLLGPDRKECAKSNHHTLKEHDRSVTYKGDGTKCDNVLPHGPGWYRFVGPAGNIMAMEPPEPQMCNTFRPGWMKGTLPDLRSSAVERKVCFHFKESWEENVCKFSEIIKVKNCGHFFVYQLPVTPPPRCSLRYCGDRDMSLPVNF